MRYKMKPYAGEFECHQYRGGYGDMLQGWCEKNRVDMISDADGYMVLTRGPRHEGYARISSGEWVVKDVVPGDVAVYSDTRFQSTFEVPPDVCRHGKPIVDGPNPSCVRCEFAPYENEIEAAVKLGDVEWLAAKLRAELAD